MMKEMQRNTDRAIANIENLPGGFDALKKMYHQYQEPMTGSRPRNDVQEDRMNEQMARRLNVEAVSTERVNDKPLPNPWAPPTPLSFDSPFPFQQSAFARPTTSSPADLETTYARQLSVMEDMGFTDKRRNIQALVRVGGDVDAAIDFLISLSEAAEQ
jgi:hypothetical protein